MSEYITLISPPDSTVNFSTRFDSTIALDDTFEVALIEIFHGGVCNVCATNNQFFLTYVGPKVSTSRGRTQPQKASIVRLTIPTGFYKTTLNVVEQLKSSIDDFIRTGGQVKNSYNWFKDDQTLSTINRTKSTKASNEGEVTSVKLSLNHENLKFHQPKNVETVLTLLGKSKAAFNYTDLKIPNIKLPSSDTIGMIYCSLVKSSRLNNLNTNLLAIVPLASDPTNYKYTHYSVTNPTYYPIAVTSFELISIEIRNVIQEAIHIEHLNKQDKALYPTILTLHLRKRQD